MPTTAPSRPDLSSFWHDLPRDGRLMLSTVAVNALGTGLVLPFGVIYLHEVRDIPLATVGALLALPAMVALALLGPLGALIDRIGARLVLMAALGTQIVGVTLLAFATSPVRAGVALSLLGVGQAAFWPASQSLVASVVPAAIRQRYFGVNFTLLNAGIGCGGLLSGLVVSVDHPGTFTFIYLANAATFLAPLGMLAGPLRHVGGRVVAATSAADASPVAVAPDEPASYRLVLRDPVFRRLLGVVFASAFVGYAQFEAGWTAYARTVADASTRTIGLAFAVNTLVIVVLQMLVLQRIEGRHRTRVLMVMSAVWAGSWSLMGLAGLVPGSVVASVLLVSSMGVFALGETLMSPVVPAITNDLAPDALRGRYNAVASVAFQVAAIVGPVVAGQLLGRHLAVAFVVVILLGCGGMAVLLVRLERTLPAAANGVRRPMPEQRTAEPAAEVAHAAEPAAR